MNASFQPEIVAAVSPTDELLTVMDSDAAYCIPRATTYAFSYDAQAWSGTASCLYPCVASDKPHSRVDCPAGDVDDNARIAVDGWVKHGMEGLPI